MWGIGRLAALMGLLVGFTFACLAGILLISKVYGVPTDKLLGLLPFPVTVMTTGLALYQALNPARAKRS